MTTLKMRDGFGVTVGGQDCVVRATLGNGQWVGTVDECLVVWDEDGLATIVTPRSTDPCDSLEVAIDLSSMPTDAYDVDQLYDLDNKTVLGIDYAGNMVGPYATVGAVPSSYKPIEVQWDEGMSIASLNFTKKKDPDKVLHDVSDGDVNIDGHFGGFYQVGEDSFMFFLINSKNRMWDKTVPRKCSKNMIRKAFNLHDTATVEFLSDKKARGFTPMGNGGDL